MSIELLATFLMLSSAILHAAGSTLLKSSAHIHAVRGISLITSSILALGFVAFVPFPTSKTWLLLLCSALIHPVVILLSVATLERGDLGLVYPIMRGGAPVISGILAFVLLGEGLSIPAMIGLVIVALALLMLAGISNQHTVSDDTQNLILRFRNAVIADRTVFLLALTTAAFTALYSVIDAAGVRSAINPWSYIVWFGVVVEPLCAGALWWQRRATFVGDVRQEWRKGLLFFFITTPGFAMAIYLFSLGPVARLSALRETSVLFAALFATLFLKERFGLHRIGLALIISFGLWLMHQ